MARGGGRLFEGGDYFKYFGQRGAIIRGTAIIRGNTVSSFDTEVYSFIYICIFICISVSISISISIYIK